MRKLLIIALSILFFSCEKSGFDFSSPSLFLERRNSVERLSFRVSLDDEQSSYFATIASPDGLLRWQGNLEKGDDDTYSLTLEITPEASFIPGEYTFEIYSSGGVEKSGSVSFLREEFSVFLENGTLGGSMEGSGMIGERSVVIGSEASEGEILHYTDQYFNEYEVVL